QRESTGRQHDTAQHIEANPPAPGKLIVQVRRGAKSTSKADHCGVKSRNHQHQENQLPEGQLDFHWLSSSFFFMASRRPGFPSANATSSRRCVIHQIPPSSTPP